MRTTFKRAVAAMLAAITVIAPADAWADGCSRYRQVESDATGGDYVGGLLFYETTATVTRPLGSGSSTSGTIGGSFSGPGGIGGTSGSFTATSSTMPTMVTTQEPVGFYSMVDGSVYMIDCVTGENAMIMAAG